MMATKMLIRKLVQKALKLTSDTSTLRSFKTNAYLHYQIYHLHEVSAPPNACGLPVIGAFTSIIKAKGGELSHEYIDNQHKKYGPIFRGRIGPVKAVFVSDSDAIRRMFSIDGTAPQSFVPEAWLLYNQRMNRSRGLLFMNGEEWKKNRQVLNKIMLSRDSTNYMIKPCSNATSELVDKWKAYAKDQTVADLENQLYQLSIEVILATLMGDSWQSYRPQIQNELVELSRKLSQIFVYSVKLSKLPARLAEMLNLPAWRGFVNTTNYCMDSVGRIVNDLMKLRSADNNMLDLMINNGLDEPTVCRIVIDFIIAAGDTTAHAIQWLLFLLTKNQEAQERLYESVRELEAMEALQSPLLKGAIKETLRLYPIAPFITRFMPQKNFLDRYLIEQGELVIMSIYTCSRSESYFPSAQEFRPERWLRNDKGEYLGVNNPNASLPFAMGIKSCIGKKLAETQLSLLTVELLKNFRIDCLNKKNISIKLRLITAPSEPLQLQLTSRK